MRKTRPSFLGLSIFCGACVGCASKYNRGKSYFAALSLVARLILTKCSLGPQFDLGRDAVATPAKNVHRQITNGSTELAKANRIYRDGRLRLDWRLARMNHKPHL